MHWRQVGPSALLQCRVTAYFYIDESERNIKPRSDARLSVNMNSVWGLRRYGADVAEVLLLRYGTHARVGDKWTRSLKCVELYMDTTQNNWRQRSILLVFLNALTKFNFFYTHKDSNKQTNTDFITELNTWNSKCIRNMAIRLVNPLMGRLKPQIWLDLLEWLRHWHYGRCLRY